MRQFIRTPLLLSATALFAAACTNMPMEGQDTSYNSGYTSPTVTNNVPEAGPLSETTAANTYAAAPVTNQVPAATAPQPVPVATVPQVPAANYTPPVDNSGGYDVYAAGNAAPVNNYDNYAAPAAPATVDYSQPQAQPQASYNDSYTSYGPVNTAAANTNTYAPVNTNTATYDPYANSGGGAAYTNTYASAGGAAVQVFATGSAAKAERIRQDMQSQGLPAVVDQVGGLYKVRIPYGDEGAARANLIRVRQVSGESGAFVTTR